MQEHPRSCEYHKYCYDCYMDDDCGQAECCEDAYNMPYGGYRLNQIDCPESRYEECERDCTELEEGVPCPKKHPCCKKKKINLMREKYAHKGWWSKPRRKSRGRRALTKPSQ